MNFWQFIWLSKQLSIKKKNNMKGTFKRGRSEKTRDLVKLIITPETIRHISQAFPSGNVTVRFVLVRITRAAEWNTRSERTR